MNDATPQPNISVAMPTYKRPDMLRRAVACVQNQTFDDWELLVSDDEQPAGQAWAYLQEAAAEDPRIRIFQNPGDHGQIPNNNYVMAQARGRWIKPLFDDDVLRADCLAQFAAAVAGREDVALVCCLADMYVNGQLDRPAERGARAKLERVTGRDALFGAYVQDIDIGTPVQCMVRADIVHRGVQWERVQGMSSAFDTWWLLRTLEHGDLLLLNQGLIEQHWGHVTGTTEMQADPTKLDRDYVILRQLLRDKLAGDPRAPGLTAVCQQLKLIRAMVRLRDRRWGDAAKLIAGCWHPKAWVLFRRWLKNKRHPGARPVVERQVIEA